MRHHPTSRTGLRTRLAEARSTRRQCRVLARELAGYDTPAARLELEAVLARHSDEEAAPIRAILRAQDADRLVRTLP